MWGKRHLAVLLMVLLFLPAGCGEQKVVLSECAEVGLTVSVTLPQTTVAQVAVKAEGIEPLTAPPVILFVVPEETRGLEGVWRFNGQVEGGPAVSRKSDQWKTVIDAITTRCGGSLAGCVPDKAWTFMVTSKPDGEIYTATLDLYGVPEDNWRLCTAWVMGTRAECYGLTSVTLGRPGS